MPRTYQNYPFLAGGGEAADIIASFDWASTSIGPIESWPASQRSAISFILRSPVPIVTLWGEDGIMIYNDGYSGFAGGRHPELFGSKVREGWPEVADFNDNIMKVCYGQGGVLAYRDQILVLSRHDGVPEEVWLDLDYSPLLDEEGKPAAVMAIVVEITEKIKVQRELEAERESLRRMFEQAPGFIAVTVGPQHQFTMVNDAYSTLVGGREMVGKTVAQALPEVTEQGFVELLDQVYKTGEPFIGRGAKVGLAYGGTGLEERYLDFIYQPIIAEGGRISGVFIQGHDVTEQKLSEIALRESEERFRLVAENAPVMLWMSDISGRCIYLNKSQREFWGIAGEGPETFDWLDTVHSDDRKLMAPSDNALRTHSGFSVEARMRRADGKMRVVRTNAEPRFGPRREFLGMIGVNVDVTRSRRTENAIRNESRKLSILNRTGAEIGAELDVDRVIQIVTDACKELVGAEFGSFFYKVEDASSEEFISFPAPRAAEIFQPTFNGGGVVRSDDILADPRYGGQKDAAPEGRAPVRSYLAVPVALRSGEVIGGLFFGHTTPRRFDQEHEDLLSGIAGQAATAIDNARLFQEVDRELAERKRAESALQTLNATLEQRVLEEVQERSKAEEQLRQMQKMEAVGQLTGGIAHDFNNMLAVIIGGLNLLQRKLAKGETDVQRFVEGATDAAQRAASLTQRLLAFSRQQPLAPEPVSANRMVSDMSELMVRTLGETIAVQTVLAAGLWQIKADPGQLENAILNLSVNARDAMPHGGKLTIETSNAFVDEAFAREFAIPVGQYVLIAVADSGDGMTPEVIAKAFDPFYTTKGVGKGTGLGLSQVYGFVRQSGGHVKIYSEIGVGTTVKIYLPRYYGEALDTTPKETPSTSHRGLASEIIMVVEDEDRVRAVSVEALRELGYTVLEAPGPLQALRMFDEGTRVSLLFTDVVMPDMSGRELADQARARQTDLKVLYTTGYTRNAIVHNGILDPGTSLLTKPFNINELAVKVRKLLDE